MLFDFNRFSGLLLIFFVHGIVYAALLARRASMEERRADGWLAAFLLLCVFYITPWMVGFAGWYDTQPYRDLLFYIPFQHLFMLGPMVYFYVQSLLNPSFRFGRRQWLHFLPAAGYLAYSAVIVVTDKLVLHRYWFLESGQDPDFDQWYQLTGFVSMAIYGWLSLRYYRLFRRLMLQVTSFAEGLPFGWVRHLLLAFLGMLSLKLVFYIVSLFGADDYADTWWYFFGFSLLFYFMAIKGYATTQAAPVAYRPLPDGHSAVLLPGAHSPVNSPVEAAAEPIETGTIDAASDPQWALWKPRIEALLEGEALYRDPELSLTGMARRLPLPAAQLSRIINGAYGCNFNDFINGYRVRAVQAAMMAGEHRSQTLLGIAYDCGFNSKATFNRAFLKVAGTTPREYLKGLEVGQ